MRNSPRGRGDDGATACEPPTPPRPDDEEERLRALRRYGVLDTPPEPAFDRIANLARALFDTPAAVVSLVDETRQWFKARPGFEAAETRRDWAFCAYTILSADPVVVPDTLRDPRFAGSPLVTGGPRIRFYAGAPIVTPDGLRLGSVCVASPRPRPAAAPRRDDLARLKDLAAIAMDQLEMRLRARSLAEAVAERDAALARAGELAGERDALVRGADRRVEDGLWLVHAALSAQARAEGDPRLEAAAARVLAAVSAHRHLQAGAPSAEAAADAGRYLAPLLRDLARPGARGEDRARWWWRAARGDTPHPAAGAHGRPVVLDAEPEVLLPAGALPRLGLVAVELVTNALEHGAGPVVVELRRGRDPLFAAVLAVPDEGPGFPARFAVDDPARASLGVRFVAALVGPGNLRVDDADRRRIVARLAAAPAAAPPARAVA